jgi:prevent-host-death family protein
MPLPCTFCAVEKFAEEFVSEENKPRPSGHNRLFKDPAYYRLFENVGAEGGGLQPIASRELRDKLAGILAFVMKQLGSVLVTQNGRYTAAIVSLHDLAVLLALKKHPDFLAALKELHPELKDEHKVPFLKK